MKWPPERLNLELQHYRLSTTKPREEVYRAINRLGPISRVDLVRELSGKVSKPTIYRTIKIFISARIAHELVGGLIELSPPFRQLHYFLICTGCGRRAAFWDEALEKKLNRMLETRRYVLPAHNVELSGLCYLCASNI